MFFTQNFQMNETQREDDLEKIDLESYKEDY